MVHGRACQDACLDGMTSRQDRSHRSFLANESQFLQLTDHGVAVGRGGCLLLVVRIHAASMMTAGSVRRYVIVAGVASLLVIWFRMVHGRRRRLVHHLVHHRLRHDWVEGTGYLVTSYPKEKIFTLMRICCVHNLQYLLLGYSHNRCLLAFL